ncbi:MAG: heme lyase CcmF/NrfE family subunit [Myxococcaceae bacterium]|nr:heme lyase CcmF/NrfE family subunit [Myxococcaceae bacterium]
MISTIGYSFVLGALTIAAFGGLLGIVGGLTRRESVYRWVRLSAVGFATCMFLANLTMEVALLRRDFTVSYVAQVGSHQTPNLFTVVSLWSALEGSILFWGAIMGAYLLAFALVYRKDRTRFLTIALGVMLMVGVFFAFLIAGPANPFRPTAPQVLEGIRLAGDGPGPNPLLQNHILMVVHPPMLYLGYVGMTVPFGIAVAGLLAGEMGASWMAPMRRWTLIPWVFLSTGIILGGWWAYTVLGWGGYWAWDPVENASFLPWLTATAFIHSIMVQERRQMLRVWTLVLGLATFWMTILGTFMTRSGVFNSVHAFTQSDIGPTFLVFLGLVALVSIVLLGARGPLLIARGEFKSFASREFSILINNVVFAAFTVVVLGGTVYPLIKEGLFDKKISVGEPYFNFFALPIGLLILFLMGVGPALPWGRGDAKSLRHLLPAAGAGLFTFLTSLGATWAQVMEKASAIWAPMTFGLAAFVIVVTLREMFLPARVRMREKKEDVFTALVQSIVRARRRFGGYVVHLGVVMVIIAIAASRTYSSHASGTLKRGESMTLAGYTLTFTGLRQGREPHRDWVGARLEVTGNGLTSKPGDTSNVILPRSNFYERSTDPVGTPAVRSSPREDLYVSLMAFDEKAQTASLKVWVFPMVGWIWWAIPVFGLGTLIAAWPSRRARIVSDVVPLAAAAGAAPPVPGESAPPAAGAASGGLAT